MGETFIRKADDPGYVVAWRDKYEHIAGRYAEEVMTYAQAKAKAEVLCEQHADKTFWAEKLSDELSNRFHKPRAH
ncbi:MAG: hypothetical protein OET44_05525 [Gammaproteobacteria bacterium]|nr:hypothetical protein [Gammaproteobacteria bacterium]